jgi:putative endonuclease
MSYFYLYILKSKSSNKYYTGISQNPEVRLTYHNTIEKSYTSRYKPWEIVFTKEYSSKKEALAVEKKVKLWKSKKMIERLLKGEITL